MDEELYPIVIQVTIPLPTKMIFAALTEPAGLAGWLCREARLDPRVGGEYALAFDGPPPFRSWGRLTHFTPEVDVGYDWRAPPEFDDLMNRPEPKTRVYFRLQDSPEGIDVTLEQFGWVSGPAWEEARSWHFHFWDERMTRLKEHLLKQAYG